MDEIAANARNVGTFAGITETREMASAMSAAFVFVAAIQVVPIAEDPERLKRECGMSSTIQAAMTETTFARSVICFDVNDPNHAPEGNGLVPFRPARLRQIS